MKRETIAAKVELAHRLLAMHETLMKNAAASEDKSATKADNAFYELLWEHATFDEDLLAEATIFELTTPPAGVLRVWLGDR